MLYYTAISALQRAKNRLKMLLAGDETPGLTASASLPSSSGLVTDIASDAISSINAAASVGVAQSSAGGVNLVRAGMSQHRPPIITNDAVSTRASMFGDTTVEDLDRIIQHLYSQARDTDGLRLSQTITSK